VVAADIQEERVARAAAPPGSPAMMWMSGFGIGFTR
jgi:hypothetical protein